MDYGENKKAQKIRRKTRLREKIKCMGGGGGGGL